MQGGEGLARFYRPGDGGLDSLFARGWEIRTSKELPGVCRGEWSGLELTDTLASP